MSKLKVLVAIPHFFNSGDQSNKPHGSSLFSNRKKRFDFVGQCINSYKQVFEVLGIDGRILLFGDPRNSLLPIDIDVSKNVENSLHIPWATIDYVATYVHEYDFVVVAEDDICIQSRTFKELLELELQLDSSSLVIPNRIEVFENQTFCVDLLSKYRWKTKSKSILGNNFREPINTHSGFILMSSLKFSSAYKKRKHTHPTKIGDLEFLESALANITNSFKVYRKTPAHSSLQVTHLDSWLGMQINLKNLSHQRARRLVIDSKEDGYNYYVSFYFTRPLTLLANKFFYYLKYKIQGEGND